MFQIFYLDRNRTCDDRFLGDARTREDAEYQIRLFKEETKAVIKRDLHGLFLGLLHNPITETDKIYLYVLEKYWTEIDMNSPAAMDLIERTIIG